MKELFSGEKHTEAMIEVCVLGRELPVLLYLIVLSSVLFFFCSGLRLPNCVSTDPLHPHSPSSSWTDSHTP